MLSEDNEFTHEKENVYTQSKNLGSTASLFSSAVASEGSTENTVKTDEEMYQHPILRKKNMHSTQLRNEFCAAGMKCRYIVCYNRNEVEEVGEPSPSGYPALTYTGLVRKLEAESPWWDDDYDFGGITCISCDKAVHKLCVLDQLCLYCHWEAHSTDVLSRQLMGKEELTLCSSDTGTTADLMKMQVFGKKNHESRSGSGVHQFVPHNRESTSRSEDKLELTLTTVMKEPSTVVNVNNSMEIEMESSDNTVHPHCSSEDDREEKIKTSPDSSSEEIRLDKK